MNTWGIDEILYYGGIAAVAAAVLLFLIYLAVSRSAAFRLRRTLDEEYGDINNPE